SGRAERRKPPGERRNPAAYAARLAVLKAAMPLPLQTCVDVRISPEGAVSRRGFLRLAAGSAAAAGINSAGPLTAYADESRQQNRACILRWMAGGPSQSESSDPKPESPNQGPTKAIPSAASGIRVAEHWQRTAAVMGELAVIRSMTSKEGNHGRATYLLHTSY